LPFFFSFGFFRRHRRDETALIEPIICGEVHDNITKRATFVYYFLFNPAGHLLISSLVGGELADRLAEFVQNGHTLSVSSPI
jgi:hypothetical protein